MIDVTNILKELPCPIRKYESIQFVVLENIPAQCPVLPFVLRNIADAFSGIGVRGTDYVAHEI